MSQRSAFSAPLLLDPDQRSLLTEWVQSQTLRMRLRERARIILTAADGASYRTIAAEVGTSRDRVALWCARFRMGGIEALTKEMPRGRSPKAGGDGAPELVETIAQTGSEDWAPSKESGMAVRLGASAPRRTKIVADLQPHDVETIGLADDAHFAASLEAIVGLYLSSAEHAMVLCCDGRRQARPVDASQHGASRPKSRRTTKAVKEARRNIALLLAGLRTLDGNINEDPKTAHRSHAEWLGFMRWIHRLTPPDKTLHLICDSHATCSRPNVRAWLKKHPRVRIHFVPRTAAWLHSLDRFFRNIANSGPGSRFVQSIDELMASIPGYIIENSIRPKPFVWTAKADDLL